MTKVYHLTISRDFEARDYSDEDLFDVLHQAGDIFSSVVGAQRFALEDAQRLVDEDYVEGRPRLTAAIEWDQNPLGTWTGRVPGYHDHDWLAVVLEREVHED